MTIEHKKVANAAVEILDVLSKNCCNIRESIEALRAALSRVEATEIPVLNDTDLVFKELRERFSDSDLSGHSESY